MPASKQFTIGAGLVVALGLAFSSPAFSASGKADVSAQEMIASRLQRGDLVRLRSGGPLMTVDAIKGDQVECVWTDENGQPEDATFPTKVLQQF